MEDIEPAIWGYYIAQLFIIVAVTHRPVLTDTQTFLVMAAIVGNAQLATTSPISQKRKRVNSETQPFSPPLSDCSSPRLAPSTVPDGTHLLSRAVNVLSTAATALSQVSILYETDPEAREGLLRAVECVTRVNEAGGKLIICGVGKSGLVGQKMVATMKSLGIGSSFMHAAEAIHGDLGDIRKVLHDYAVVSFSWSENVC